MNTVDFDIEKNLWDRQFRLRSVRVREDRPLPSQQSGQNQQDQHHNTPQDPDAMIQILALAHAQPFCWQSINIPSRNPIVNWSRQENRENNN